MFKKLKAIRAAWKAGAIVAQCTTGCWSDDINEQIIACDIHEHEIAALSKISLENWA